MVDFTNKHRAAYRVESICSELPIAPSTYYISVDLNAHPRKRSYRATNDESLSEQIIGFWEKNYQVYGYRQIWHSLLRDKYAVARCTVARLMNALGISGKCRGKIIIITSQNQQAVCPLDLVNREFRAAQPNELWVAGVHLRVDLVRVCLYFVCH